MRLSGMLSASAVLPLAAALAACGGGTPQAPAAGTAAGAHELDSATPDELMELAMEEGTVTVYSFTSRIASVEEAFEARYPGIDMVAHDISSSEQITRLRSESQAGTPSADVAYISDAPVVITELVAGGILQNYVPPRVADSVPEAYREPLLANRLSTKVLMYNEEAHPNGTPIENLWQLTEEEWNGRVVMVDPGVRGDYLDLMAEIVRRSDEMAQAYEDNFGSGIVLDEDVENAGQQFIKDLYANGLVLVDDTDNVNQAVGAIGQDDPPVGITSYSDRRDNDEEGWALQASLGTVPSPGITFPAYIGLVNGSENPAAARLAADFLMGDDSTTGGPAYEPFYVPGDYPVRIDMLAPDNAVSLDELGAWDIVPEETARIRDGVADFLLTL
ncbi:ABC transporter substrate-binding protein [Nocardiopsis protaetiae]